MGGGAEEFEAESVRLAALAASLATCPGEGVRTRRVTRDYASSEMRLMGVEAAQGTGARGIIFVTAAEF